MVKTRSQDGDSKGKELDVEDPMESRLSRLEDMFAERSKMMKQFADMVKALAGQQQEELQSSDVLLEEKPVPQFEVPIANSEILKSIEPGEVDLGLENQEHVVLNDNLEQEWVQKNISKRFEVGGDVERGQKMLSMEKVCFAHKVFAKMSQQEETLGIKKKPKGLKSWRFKFKDMVQPRELIQEKQVVHEAKVTRNQLRSLIGIVDDLHSNCGSDIVCVQYLFSSVVVGDLQETQWLFNNELKDIQKFQIVIKEGINSYACQEFNGICLRSHILHQQKKPSKSPKSWKFKFKISSKDNRMRYTTLWCEKTTRSTKKNRIFQGELVNTGKPYKRLRLKQHHMSQFLCTMKMFTYKKRQKNLQFMGKTASDNETDGILRSCNSGQATGSYGSEIRRWEVSNQPTLRFSTWENLLNQYMVLLLTLVAHVTYFSIGVGMDKKQSHLRNNRVWDPGGSLVKMQLHETLLISSVSWKANR